MVHCRQVALYSSKGQEKGIRDDSSVKHPIDCQTITLLSWKTNKSKRFMDQCRPGRVTWVIEITKILKWDLRPRSRWGIYVSLAQTKHHWPVTFFLLKASTMLRAGDQSQGLSNQMTFIDSWAASLLSVLCLLSYLREPGSTFWQEMEWYSGPHSLKLC